MPAAPAPVTTPRHLSPQEKQPCQVTHQVTHPDGKARLDLRQNTQDCKITWFSQDSMLGPFAILNKITKRVAWKLDKMTLKFK